MTQPPAKDECPTLAVIERFVADEVSDDERQAIEAHLSDCPACRLQVAALADNSEAIFGRIRAAQIDETLAADQATLDANAAPQRAPGSSLRLPSIDGYETVRELHRGGQGIVFQAIQKSTKRKVAIKILLEGAYASDAARRRFEREVELVAQLKHPNIIAIFDSGETADGHAFCVMDYVRGARLDEHVRAQKLSLEEAIRLFQQVCDAVNFAHQRGVIHRDLKPSNILVDADGTPKVLDFGLAKQLTSPAESLVSVTGQVVGTLPYMSPEQARGNPDEIDTRTDIYALGVILYELLTGEYPYPVLGQMADVLKHIAETPPTPPSRSWKSNSGITTRTDRRLKAGQCPIDDEMQTIVLKALSKERERRYQSAGELGGDVGRYLDGEPIEAKRDSAVYVMRKQLKRHRRRILILGVIAALLAVSTVGLFLSFRGEQRTRATEAFRRSEADDEFARLYQELIRLSRRSRLLEEQSRSQESIPTLLSDATDKFGELLDTSELPSEMMNDLTSNDWSCKAQQFKDQPFSQWIRNNQVRLDEIVSLSRLYRFDFSRGLQSARESGLSTLTIGSSEGDGGVVRAAVRSLLLRSMSKAKTGDCKGAVADLTASRAIVRSVGDDPSVVARSLEMTLRGNILQTFESILLENSTSKSDIDLLVEFIESEPRVSDLADTLYVSSRNSRRMVTRKFTKQHVGATPQLIRRHRGLLGSDADYATTLDDVTEFFDACIGLETATFAGINTERDKWQQRMKANALLQQVCSLYYVDIQRQRRILQMERDIAICIAAVAKYQVEHGTWPVHLFDALEEIGTKPISTKYYGDNLGLQIENDLPRIFTVGREPIDDAGTN